MNPLMMHAIATAFQQHEQGNSSGGSVVEAEKPETPTPAETKSEGEKPQGDKPKDETKPGADAEAFKKLTEDGRTTGYDLASAVKQGEIRARDLLTKAAERLMDYTDGQVIYWLTGYEKGLLEVYPAGRTASNMKSDANAIIGAFRNKDYRQVEGMNEDKTPKFVQKSGKDWLTDAESQKLGWHAWLALARKVRGATGRKYDEGAEADKAPTPQERGSRIPTKVTPKGMTRVEQTMKVLDSNQAADAVTAAMPKLSPDAQVRIGKVLAQKVAPTSAAAIAIDYIPKASAEGSIEIMEKAADHLLHLDVRSAGRRYLQQIENLATRLTEFDDTFYRKAGEKIQEAVAPYLDELQPEIQAAKAVFEADERLRKEEEAKKQVPEGEKEPEGDKAAQPEQHPAEGTEQAPKPEQQQESKAA